MLNCLAMAPVPARGGVPAPRPLYAGQPRTHEAEDLDKLSQAVFEPETWNFQHDLHKAILLNENLGTTLPDEFLDKERLTAETSVMTLKGRLMTFPQNWSGWPRLEMARCGLYINENGRVTCFVCEIMFRGMTTRDACHMERHRQLAPNCLAHKYIDNEPGVTQPPRPVTSFPLPPTTPSEGLVARATSIRMSAQRIKGPGNSAICEDHELAS